MPNPGSEAVGRLARRDKKRTEAELQADIYVLLTAGGLQLDPDAVAKLEVQIGDGTRRSLDVEIGHCVIEVKKDLRVGGVRDEAVSQLAGYVTTQQTKTGSRYVGILTDGTEWILFHDVEGQLQAVTSLIIGGATDHERIVAWLEAILATRESIPPTPDEIEQRLGANSPSHLLDHASLKTLWDDHQNHPEAELKRNLWARLLRTAFGKAFSDDDDLFIDHTLLVLTAKTIAHAVLGYDVSASGNVTPTALARGTAFTSAQIHGVVEADFFDWVLQVPGGVEFVRTLADRVSRFTWDNVEHDVLKILYESVIPAETRASLGEYYTPDWLAERVTEHAVTDSLNERVLDPACGSGTFIFHAVRHYLSAADAAGMTNNAAVTSLTDHVFGMDVHPVAVTLARVTYLLAIGKDRLADDKRGPITVPVYLGDSVQWEQHRTILNQEDQVVIATAGDDLVEGGGGTLFGDDLIFPVSVLEDAQQFDRLVSAMADKALDTSNRKSKDLVKPILRQFGIHANDEKLLYETFDTMRRLHASGRDHIWGYCTRNLIRPVWLARAAQNVDVLIGNPPWLRYSKMTDGMQEKYKVLAKSLGLLSGPLGASSRDLSTLFAARTCELYLKSGGRFSYVMPYGALTRKPHAGFRSGAWHSKHGGELAQFERSWDLQACTTGFPMVSCVINGTVGPAGAKAMPVEVDAWTLKLKNPNVTWAVAAPKFSQKTVKLTQLDSADDLPVSAYKSRFRQGAILVPRVLVMAVPGEPGPLGAGAGRVALTSRRTTQEKRPWKFVESISATVEKAFARPVHLGETLLPFRMLTPITFVLPITQDALLTSEQIEENPGLDDWGRKAEATWEKHKTKTDQSSLVERINYFNQLESQLPVATHRVVYSASGNSLAAARIGERESVIEHKLYWSAVSGVDEARYLVAILNSQTVLDRVKPLQAIGLFGPRDFDKNVFSVNVPIFDSDDGDHQKLVKLAERAEKIAESLDIQDARDFKVMRKLVRNALENDGVAALIETAVDVVAPPVVV